MSTITIKDLSENIDLDRKAMLTISGGARHGAYPRPIQAEPPSEFRLVNYPRGIRQIPPGFGNSSNK